MPPQDIVIHGFFSPAFGRTFPPHHSLTSGLSFLFLVGRFENLPQEGRKNLLKKPFALSPPAHTCRHLARPRSLPAFPPPPAHLGLSATTCHAFFPPVQSKDLLPFRTVIFLVLRLWLKRTPLPWFLSNLAVPILTRIQFLALLFFFRVFLVLPCGHPHYYLGSGGSSPVKSARPSPPCGHAYTHVLNASPVRPAFLKS